MTHHFLINPAAGRGDLTEALVRKITRVCEEKGVAYHIYKTTRPGDATRYVREAANEPGPHRFYACGGDGTLSEVVNGAPGREGIEFAVIPVGTGNDFVRNFTAPENFVDIERQIDGQPMKIDLIRYNGRYSVNMINMGFDCNAAKKAGEIKRSRFVPNGCAYWFGVGITLFSHLGTKMQIELDDGTVIRDELLLSAVANGAFCGGGFNSNPRAVLNDGLLDICVVKLMSRAKFIRMVSYYKKGTHLESERCRGLVDYYQTSRVRFRFEKPINISVDGEIEITDTVEMELVPAATVFSVPYGSAVRPIPVPGIENADATAPDADTDAPTPADAEMAEEAPV